VHLDSIIETFPHGQLIALFNFRVVVSSWDHLPMISMAQITE
jgi:hypothetical protein